MTSRSSCRGTWTWGSCSQIPLGPGPGRGGRLIALAIDRGRHPRPDLKVGICGEHGGDASSVKFCHKVGMNYVSCSPYLILGARLAAAQARIRDRLAGGTDHL